MKTYQRRGEIEVDEGRSREKRGRLVEARSEESCSEEVDWSTRLGVTRAVEIRASASISNLK